MYTKIRDSVWKDHWMIIDTYGVVICPVIGEETADILLSHLNR